MRPPQLRLPTFAGELGRIAAAIQSWADQLVRAVPKTMEPLPTQTADYWARPEQIVPVDTSGGLVTVYLPPADRTNAGRMVTVTRVAGAASFSTRAVSGTVGRAGVHTATSGSRLFVSDGNGDWMVFA